MTNPAPASKQPKSGTKSAKAAKPTPRYGTDEPSPGSAHQKELLKAASVSTAPVQTAAGSRPPPSQAGASPHQRPEHWDEITVGDLVLAYDAETEGWFDAIVLRVEGDLLRLRWRNYPREHIAPQRRNQLALLPPSA
jgi:hypothetical protein